MNHERKPLVLVADDDEFSRTLATLLLEQLDCHVEVATDGQEAVEAVKQFCPDLVLMDCMMPTVDGYAATRSIRSLDSDQYHSGIPVIALTGHATDEDQTKYVQAGMNEAISKPLQPGTLEQILRQYLPGFGKEGAGMQPGDLLIEKFLSEIPDTIELLATAASGGQSGELEFLGHRLRGAAEVMGVSSISRLAASVEHAGRKNDINLARTETSRLIAELQNLAGSMPADSGNSPEI